MALVNIVKVHQSNTYLQWNWPIFELNNDINRRNVWNMCVISKLKFFIRSSTLGNSQKIFSHLFLFETKQNKTFQMKEFFLTVNPDIARKKNMFFFRDSGKRNIPSKVCKFTCLARILLLLTLWVSIIKVGKSNLCHLYGIAKIGSLNYRRLFRSVSFRFVLFIQPSKIHTKYVWAHVHAPTHFQWQLFG